MVEPPKLITEPVEPKYRSIRTDKLLRAAEVSEVESPALTQDIQIKTLTSPGEVKWGEVFCKENFPFDKVKELQLALGSYYTTRGGRIDGAYGSRTSAAVNAFQADRNLVQGGLTVETLGQLGVAWPE